MLTPKQQLLFARKIYLNFKHRELVYKFQEAIKLNNSIIPVFLVSYNNGKYVENSVYQLNKFNIKPIIIDNASDDKNSIRTILELEKFNKATIIRSKKNLGHLIGFIDPIYDCLPKIFGYSDPDLQFNEKLPSNFLEVLANLTQKYSVFKAGFSLNLASDSEMSKQLFTKNKSKPFAFSKIESTVSLPSLFSSNVVKSSSFAFESR
jgi:hypothetical protein